jgi:omega-6 fatty acid desaturase (delta-12 desaturase)
MINREQYKSLIGQLSFERKLSINLLVMAIDVVFFFVGLQLLSQQTLLTYCLAQPLFAVVFLHAFLILHEAGHNACAPSSWMNVIMGHVASIFCCMPFYSWKYIHAEHHKWTGHLEKDPVFELLKQAKIKRKLPLIMHIGWRSFLPIGVLFLHLVYWSYPLKLLLNKKMNKTIFRNCAISVALLPLAYYLLHAVAPSLFNIANFAPSIFLYGILWELLSTPQHIGLPSTLHRPNLQDHANTTRSTHFPAWLEKYLFLNFGLHVEHHFFPALPWHELKKAQTLIAPLLQSNYKLVEGGIWNIQTRKQNMESFLQLHVK